MFGFFEKPSPAKFAQMLLKEAARRGRPADYQFDEKNFTLKRGQQHVFLGNLYKDYCHAKGDHKKRVFENALALFGNKAAELTAEEALCHATAAIRERAVFSLTQLHLKIEDSQAKDLDPAFERVSDWFVKVIVLDFPEYVRVVNVTDLEKWGISFEAMFTLGLKRLQDSTPPKFRSEDGYFVGTWNDDYDASRALLPQVFQDLPIEGNPVVCVPTRLKLLVADDQNPAAVEAMFKKAEEIANKEPRPHNPAPLTYHDGQIIDYLPEKGSPVFNHVQRARGLAGMLYYSQQKDLLEKLYEKTRKDDFVASFKFTQRSDGSYLSYSVWSRGIRTLLPKTDLIMLSDPERPKEEMIVAQISWDRAQAVLGSLMLDTEMFPPRFYVSQFPSVEQLKELVSNPGLELTQAKSN